jgi:hypothetical protein
MNWDQWGPLALDKSSCHGSELNCGIPIQLGNLQQITRRPLKTQPALIRPEVPWACRSRRDFLEDWWPRIEFVVRSKLIQRATVARLSRDTVARCGGLEGNSWGEPDFEG